MAAVAIAAEDREVREDISWEAYQEMLRAHEYRSLPHHNYDHGTLEIVSPMPIHERCKRHIEVLIAVYAEEQRMNLDGFGSTTYSRADLQRGFEPDSSYYIQNWEQVQGKARLDLRVDPPPDMVVEIDITHSTLDKLPIFFSFGVSEVWRYNGDRFQVLLRADDGYRSVAVSPSLPIATVQDLEALLNEHLSLNEAAWTRFVRRWLRGT